MTKAFLDTNVLVYAFSVDARSEPAEALLAQGADISVQVLNEFTNVARRKLKYDWSQIHQALAAIRALARAIHPIDLETHERALGLAQRYGFAFYDALIVASALGARCGVLFSEDMQDGLEIEGGLRISNPFG
jgi:predicted nucleic acid-binding protein